jgi:histidinol-phosphate phosphatase family protein
MLFRKKVFNVSGPGYERRAVFIDKDGTLIRNIPYNVDPMLIELTSSASSALKQLKAKGYLLIVISNQSGVAHNYFPETALQNVVSKIQKLLEEEGVEIDSFYFCPHHVYGSHKEFAIACGCRKPKPGMLIKAAFDYGIDLRNSWMVGDTFTDIAAANNAGCKSIWLKGRDCKTKGKYKDPANYIVYNWDEIANVILSHSNW